VVGVPRQLAELPQRRRAVVRALSAAALCAALAAPARAEVVVSDGRYAMGTILEITLAAPDAAAGRALLDESYAIAARLEASMTLYDEKSDLVRLNRAAGSGLQTVDPELARLLAESLELGRRTRGAFDVTVGPLVELWKAAAARGRRPSDSDLAATRALVGPAVLRVVLPDRAEIAPAGAAVDLGGVAKGFALDRIAERLRRAGVASALLSFGQSSLWAIGAPPGEAGWRLLVRRPDGGFAGVATLRDRAVSVSGSLGQWTEIEGRRYGHVLDPRSGEPLIRPLEAIVLAPTATLGEAASKALLVLGAEEGVPLLAVLGCEGLLVDAAGKRYETAGWQAASHFEAEASPPSGE
jgi:thiamine biosynthesis lipoprotein